MADLVPTSAFAENIPAMVRIGDYLADRLYALGVRHVFTGPVAPPTLAATMDSAGIDVVRMSDDAEAGVAADAYGRMRGIGVALAGYGASGLSLINAAAQAHAERSPLLVIAEIPDRTDWRFHPLLSTAAFNPAAVPPQRRAFEPVVASAITLDAPDIACREIEQGLMLMTARKQPVYLEVSASTLSVTTTPMPAPLAARTVSDPAVLTAAIADAVAMIRDAAHPVILIGVEIQRFNLQNAVLQFMATSGIPAATTLLGKSVIGEHVPGFMGIYAPDESHSAVRRLVEESDGLLLLGARGMDLSPGGDPPPIDPGRRLIATADRIQVGHRRYDGITLTDFVSGLVAVEMERRVLPAMPGARVSAPVVPNDETPLTRDGVFATLAQALTDEMVIVADAGAALLTVADLPVQLCSEFMSPASYGGRGFAIPGSIGVGLAEPELRTVVLVEVAALARNGWELSTARRLGLAPIVIALGDDHGATGDWDPRHLTDVIGGGWSVRCQTVGEFANAVSTAGTRRNEVALIHARLAVG
ncbi:MAG TPA: thiamine pyrophosphate-binding protein [Thermomicrobiales bacterium]|jgi:indolepyruvate decarboxylase|nr:thiamine pyrophosphate-binding protein [Thermomicrobiales bacterium]